MLFQCSAPNDRVTCVRFDIDVSGVKGALRFVFPTLFLNVLIQQIKLDQPQERGAVRYLPGAPLRERILDCDIDLAVELTGLRVSVRDVVAMQPGSVVKLRAPVKTPGMLTASGLGLFEAMPVRNGGQKAAQLGRRIAPAAWERK
jgi:flagellar motor switch protein FliM